MNTRGRPRAVPRLGLPCLAVGLLVLPASPLSGEQVQTTQVGTEPWVGSDPTSFETVDAREAGFDPDMLATAVALAGSGDSDALLIARHGKLVLERYWHGKTSDDVQQMYSATKSPFTYLDGRALELGLLRSLDQPVIELVPELAGDGRETMTFRSIMAMASGLEQTTAMDQADRRTGRSQLQSVLARRVEREPYEYYIYNNAAYRLLFTALERATGRSIPDFSRDELFAPLGMNGAYWVEHRANGILMGYQSIRMRPRDMVKVGQVMLNGGEWAGERYLPEAYLAELLAAPAPDANPSYGLFWHLNSGDFYLSYAESNHMEGNLLPGTPRDAIANYGSGGQVVVVVPSLDLVWVRTGPTIESAIWARNNFVARLSAAIADAVRPAPRSN